MLIPSFRGFVQKTPSNNCFTHHELSKNAPTLLLHVWNDLTLDIYPEYCKLTYRDSVADAHNSFDFKII
jgi:hypothetical protein